MTTHQVRTTGRKLLNPKEATEALLAKRAAPKAVTTRILEGTPKPIPAETRRSRGTAARAAAAMAKPIDHAVVAAAFPIANMPEPAAIKLTLLNVIPPYRLLKSEEIPTSAWMRYRDNPRQRDVKERLAKGRASHLLEFDEAHRRVTVGKLPDGSVYKADGHTRAYVWRTGLVDGPDSVFVDVYECKDIAAIKSLYDKFDNGVTTETGSDRVNGAAKETGLVFESAMMRSGEISTAVRSLWNFLEKTRPKRGENPVIISNAMKRFAPELSDLDRCGPTKKRFQTCVVMAALLTLRADRENALHFWKNYAEGLSEKTGGMRDALAVFEDRLPAILKKGNGSKERDAMCEAIGAINAYSQGRTYTVKRGYQSIDGKELREYATKAYGAK